ncbi:O-antigen ligase family protein [Candidatus Peregrinibacteria bacterium]|nr:O-antigen ligase family protein [Candidatus Peregrinibacteria bacterium]MBT7736535.1 O-antigen ligase family protein [Candidatus Peregrinibacteria bacterium]
MSDIFLLLSVLFFGFSYARKREHVLWKGLRKGSNRVLLMVCVFVCSIFLSLLFSANVVNSLFYLGRVLEFFVLFLILSSGFLDIKKFARVFIGVVLLISIIGIFQYIFQESLGLRFFGEPVLNSRVLGVAKVDVFSDKVLRIYGTFPHPNIFAAYIVFALFMSFEFLKGRIFRTAVVGILCLALVLTFSRSALLGFAVAYILYVYLKGIKIPWKYIGAGALVIFVIGLLMGFLPVLLERLVVSDLHTLGERGLYLDISRGMFDSNVFGVGIGNFTYVMQSYTTLKIDPWLFQPVHNMFFLLFNELGFVGGFSFVFLFFISLFSFMKKALVISKKQRGVLFAATSFLIFILIVGFFDHYFISLYQGQALLWTYLGFGAYALGLE